MVRSGLSD